MKVKFTVDICEGCSAFTNYPSCYNCPYFDDSYLMYEPDDDEEDEDFEEYEKRMLEEDLEKSRKED